jgi:hypothetical protein
MTVVLPPEAQMLDDPAAFGCGFETPQQNLLFQAIP